MNPFTIGEDVGSLAIFLPTENALEGNIWASQICHR
jgi:hypothetical protein